MTKNRPNIVFIFTDQHYAGAMSCAGNDELKTPAMDRLAAEGMRFENAYCTYPLCTPSRASMATGMMPHQIDAYDNEQPIPENRRDAEIGHVMTRTGYECAWGGKWHVPEISMPDHHGFTKICDYSDWDLADACTRFLQSPHDRPFFLVASFDNPHSICEWSRQTALPWGEVADVPTDQCPNLPANFAPPAFESEALAAERFPRPRSIFRGGKLNEDDWRHYLHAYYRLTEKVDVEIGRILDVLDATGRADDTVVIFSSDHGDGLAAHRWNQKSALYEESVRVPLIVRGPGRVATERVDDDHLVCVGLDLFPTLCDYAGAIPPDDLPGSSFRPLLEGEYDPPWRDHLAVETYFGPHIGGLGTQGRMIRTKRYKYVLYSWGKYREQLIDLENDPGEMVNLAVESRYQSVLDEHRKLLIQWMEQTDDPFEGHYAHLGVRAPIPGERWRGEPKTDA